MNIRNNSNTIRIFILALTCQILCFGGASKAWAQNTDKAVYRYAVKQGETLYSISKAFSVSVAELIRNNPTANQGLKQGQFLIIPAEGQSSQPSTSTSDFTPVPDQNNQFKHTVSRGETVYGIARMYNTSVNELYRYNPSAREVISEGQTLTIPQRLTISEDKEENYRYHTIVPKETLYSVSRTYSLRPQDIVNANPGLSAETFQVGKTIRIPFFESNQNVTPYQNQITRTNHKVARGETLYSIAKQYNVSVDDITKANPMLASGLQTNMELIIPVRASASNQQQDLKAINEANLLLSQTKQSQRIDVLKVGLLLPFLDERGRGHLRLQEFYEGFLLAVDKMKSQGANIELYVFEIGKGNDVSKLKSLLGTMEMQSLNLVIGGTNDAQIKTISDFSKAYNVKYVVPFSISNTEVMNNSNMFMANPPHTSTYPKVSKLFLNEYKNANVIFVNTTRNDKKEFVQQLQQDIKKQRGSYETISLSTSLSSNLKALLNSGKTNVIIPSSSDQTSLTSLTAELKMVVEANPGIKINLFGYPEWKTYKSSVTKQLNQFDTKIFTTFYVDNNNIDVKQFTSTFRKWYGRGMMDLYPQYGLWGYDIGLYFMSALKQHGTLFEQRINRLNADTIQHPFYFERVNNWGGFVNNGVYILNFTPNGMVVKVDRSR